MISPAEKCEGCGDYHTYTEAGVHILIHALMEIADMAERSDAHPDLQFGPIARTALRMKDAPDSTSAPQEIGSDSQVTHPFVPQTPDYPSRVGDSVCPNDVRLAAIAIAKFAIRTAPDHDTDALARQVYKWALDAPSAPRDER